MFRMRFDSLEIELSEGTEGGCRFKGVSMQGAEFSSALMENILRTLWGSFSTTRQLDASPTSPYSSSNPEVYRSGQDEQSIASSPQWQCQWHRVQQDRPRRTYRPSDGYDVESIQQCSNGGHPRHYELLRQHHRAPCPAIRRTRLPRKTTAPITAYRGRELGQDSRRHGIEDHAWYDTLAEPGLYGFLPRQQFIPWYDGRTVVCGSDRSCIQLALLACRHRTRDNRYGLGCTNACTT
jgi:hypothetical protein